ncbi:MAG: DUF1330 domain-containing protein [Rhodobiaceae bacterium]|nr:DUF1330 domain-containing protein [Rhodobiaceae bacterium]MCC0016024.1 DUF1330 domain-containing protein [Rhodobiaceae bacterium]
MADRKAYWIARVDVADPDAYKNYAATNGVAFAKYGARFLARGGDYEAMEGKARARNVIIEFPSMQVARDCYNSPEYQASAAHRKGAAEIELVLVEGYDGPQPGE